ncbi:MAG TPA: hypothetical protein VMU53_06100 [Candidatus Sulfotelmatobacter sp.]|nr:hypothetical protein [Candidatus Sulfotelmatobacter sp.]
MKRILGTVLFLLAICYPVRAQMGMDFLRKPLSFTKVFHPVVGQGAEYQMTKSGPNNRVSTMQLGIVGKDSVGGQDAYWMQMVMNMENNQSMVSKVLLTTTDFQPTRVIMQMPGRPAMEMPVGMNSMNRDKMNSSLQDWHSAGTESVTVPAGTFSCEHWKNDKTGDEVWTSDKVSPFGMVKSVGKDNSMILVKVLSDYPDRITGPVQKFDPQMMMQQQMQRPQ